MFVRYLLYIGKGRNMDKELLYKFFDGMASTAEKEVVKRWLEETPEHHADYIKEREFFDAVILSENKFRVVKKETIRQTGTLRLVWREALKMAATIAIVVSCGYYFYAEKMNEIKGAVNIISVPAGQRANLILPDGTNVWLNARSEIKYPSFFTDSKREIELTGEAYFEVTHKNEQPFIVHTEMCDVEVLGTKFNVEAYAGSDKFSTALMEGSVKVVSIDNPSEIVLLKPNYKADIHKGVLSASRIEDFDPYSWREGLICFKNTDFMQLMCDFEKYYGVTIIIRNKRLSDHVFSGKFRIADGIDNALRVLQKEAKYSFTRSSSDESIIYIQ